jgi:putative ABC transport system permease protein
MNTLRQIGALTHSALRSIPQRLGASLVTIVGITTVMAVLVSLLALGQGVKYLAGNGVRDDRAAVVQRGAQSSLQSNLPRNVFGKISELPGVKRDAQGRPLSAGSTALVIDAVSKQNQRTSVGILGSTPMLQAVRPELRIIEGRWFQPGLHELIMCDAVRTRFKGFELGGHIRVHGEDWTIVGVFAAWGGLFDNDLVTDADTLNSALSRNNLNTITVVLDAPSSFAKFKKAVADDPTLDARAETEAEASQELFTALKGILDFVSYFVGGIMALGAVCGALASLYAAVDARRREIATLRAIGFSSGPVVLSVLIEGIVLAVPAALLGAAIAWYLFNGHVVAALGLTFPLTVSLHSVGVAVGWSLAIAVIGGFLPALRVADMPVASALRAT